MDQMEFDMDVVTACDALRDPQPHGVRIVGDGVHIRWWRDPAGFYAAVCVGPAGAGRTKIATQGVNAQRYALSAYIHRDLQTYEEETEWSTR